MKRDLKTLKDVEIALRPYVPLVKELTGLDTVLDRIVPLMEYLGHPENKITTIHLAGTSGKTSTAYYIASLLNLAGKNVGLTVSPHIDKISERAQINGQTLDEATFAKQLSEFIKLVEASKIKPSYFELMYAFSIWLFAKLEVDYAVIETGVGGLYDATNVVTREDKICVITDIGFDHMSILGNTIKEITSQKVGIVHRHNTLLMYQQSEEVMSVIEAWVKGHDATLKLTNQNREQSHYGNTAVFNKLPDFQKRNWLLAYYVYRFVAQRDSLKDLPAQLLSRSQKTIVPARMDTVKKGKHTLIMDGAHNDQKMTAFLNSYKHLYPNTKPAIMLAFKSDKAYLKTLPQIIEIASEIIVTSFKSSQDLPAVSCPPQQIAEALTKAGAKSVHVEPDSLKAYNHLLSLESKQLIVTGSFYLIAQLRQKIND